MAVRCTRELAALGALFHPTDSARPQPVSGWANTSCSAWPKSPIALSEDQPAQIRRQASDDFDLSVTTSQGVVVGVIGGYEQGGCTPAMSYPTRVTPNLSALYASVVASG